MFNKLSGAQFSDCEKYRYLLWRVWDEAKPSAVFLMLNPSTADEIDNDPTVERCQRRVHALGYGTLRVVNIFAYRSTDPAPLYDQEDPVGPHNDASILQAAKDAGIVICGWGANGSLMNRGHTVLKLLQDHGITPHYLELNMDGSPRHPLYTAYSVQPKPFPRIQ